MATDDYTGIVGRQSYVSKSGRKWEIDVMNFLNDSFEKSKTPLKVIYGKTIKKGSQMWNNLGIPVGEGKTASKIEGDIDLGTETKPAKDRLLAEHYLDGVYINNKKTSFGGKIKRIGELPSDLKKWLS